jgi:hypothetical protein
MAVVGRPSSVIGYILKEKTMDNPKMTTTAQTDQPAPESPTKESYAPPAIVYRAPLEAVAGECTPTPPGKAEPGTCTTLAS